jgi:hypothetical protein
MTGRPSPKRKFRPMVAARKCARTQKEGVLHEVWILFRQIPLLFSILAKMMN